MNAIENKKTNTSVWVILVSFFLLCSAFVIYKKTDFGRPAPREISPAETAVGEKALAIADWARSYMRQESYVQGSDGAHLYLRPNTGKGEREYIEEFSKFTAEIQKYCTDRGIDFIFELDPSKIVVYDEYFDYDDKDRHARNEYIIEQMTANGVNVVYTLDAMLKEKESTPVYGLRYDAGHWNSDGAFAALSETVNRLRENNPSIGVPSRDNYDIKTVGFTSLSTCNLAIAETAREYVPKEGVCIEITDEESENIHAFGNDAYLHYKNPSMPDAPRLLIFGGSYIQKMHKLLVPYFSEVIFIKSYFNFINYEYFITLFRPDTVIFESADYVMYDSFGDRTDMNLKRHIPPYSTVESIPESPFCFPVSIGVEPTEKKSSTCNITARIIAQDIYSAHIIIGDRVYDCSLWEDLYHRGIFYLRSGVTAGEGADARLVLTSKDKAHRQVIDFTL